MKSLNLRAVVLSAVALPLLLTAFDAQAHAHLVRSMPTANSAGPAPRAVHLDFSERLEPKFSGATIMTGAGRTVVATSRASAKAVDLTPKGSLVPGPYMVMWHVLSVDGHRMKGQFSFRVR